MNHVASLVTTKTASCELRCKVLKESYCGSVKNKAVSLYRHITAGTALLLSFYSYLFIYVLFAQLFSLEPNINGNISVLLISTTVN